MRGCKVGWTGGRQGVVTPVVAGQQCSGIHLAQCQALCSLAPQHRWGHHCVALPGNRLNCVIRCCCKANPWQVLTVLSWPLCCTQNGCARRTYCHDRIVNVTQTHQCQVARQRAAREWAFCCCKQDQAIELLQIVDVIQMPAAVVAVGMCAQAPYQQPHWHSSQAREPGPMLAGPSKITQTKRQTNSQTSRHTDIV